MNLIPTFKVSLHAPVFPHEISSLAPASQWLCKSSDPEPSLWSMILPQREKYEIFPSLQIKEFEDQEAKEESSQGR
jgi:hypothetical protein